MPDHIVRELRSHPICGPSLFSESALEAIHSHTKEYKQEKFQSVLSKGVSKQLSASASRASLSKDQNPKIGILKIGKFRRVLVLVPFEVPINHVVESLPGVGARSPDLNLNNDVLQEVRVTLELSKVPLIPPDPSTLPVGGRLGYIHLNWKFLGAHPSVIKTLECGLPIGPVRIPLSRVPLINSHYSSLEKNIVLCQAVVDMLLKGAVQEVRDSSSLAFYSRLFLVAKKTGGWGPVIDLSHLNLYLDYPTFRMETTQSIRNSLQIGQWTTSLDLKDAYFHIPMAPSVHKLQ